MSSLFGRASLILALTVWGCGEGGTSDGSVVLPGAAGSGVPATPSTPAASEGPPTSFLEIERCLGVPGGEQADCMDAFVVEYTEAQSLTIPDLLVEMEASRALSQNFETHCHSIAHAVGRTLYRQTESVPESFETCDETCHSGCYHGVMERVFLPLDESHGHPTLENVQAVMPTVCSPDQFEEATPSLLFQCNHGVGHAVVFTLGYNLELSMETCGLAPTPREQGDCRGGAFMENAAGVNPTLRDLDPEDPHYPCNKFEGAIQAECYNMQTSVMSEYGLTDEEIVSECQQAGDATPMHASVLQCMKSVGRHLSPFGRTDDPERLRVACEDLPTLEAHSNECIFGAIAALIDNSWDGRFALPFCNLLESDGLRATCYELSRRHLVGVYLFDREGWLGECAAHAGTQQTLCEETFPDPTAAP